MKLSIAVQFTLCDHRSSYNRQRSIVEVAEGQYMFNNCVCILFSIYIALYYFWWLLAAWNMFSHVMETFLCIMLPSMNRFLNLQAVMENAVELQILNTHYVLAAATC